jgi:uncharacterized protein YerC
MNNEIPGELWVEYASLQERALSNHYVGPPAWAIEDQLNTFLRSLSGACLAADAESRTRQFNNLAINRTRKHKHRARLLTAFAATQTEVSAEKLILDKLIQDQTLVTVRSLVSVQEWRVLRKLAHEKDYQTVAQEEGISLPALKVRVYRCRCRLRQHLAA